MGGEKIEIFSERDPNLISVGRTSIEWEPLGFQVIININGPE
jgi:hypothetical protein